MYKISALFLLCACLLSAGSSQAAGETPNNGRDSISKAVAVDILLHRFCIAGDMYKVQKYKLDYAATVSADSLFLACVKDYRQYYESMVPEKRAQYFSDAFYETVIPVVQYFRMPELARTFLDHQALLHPKKPVPDPKHHEGHEEHQHQ